MLFKWLPWKYVIRRLAIKHGFIDPILLLSAFRRFAQPGDVNEPIELLRAGAVFHARGLINSRVIQHNLDWIWPWWVNQQFDPNSSSFIPTAFSITHINLSSRNWTAVGLPGRDELAVVDPRGLVMPFWDSWSVDAWLVNDAGKKVIIPARSKDSQQSLEYQNNLAITTRTESQNGRLVSKTFVEDADGCLICKTRYEGFLKEGGWLVISVRPCNPEGVSFIHNIKAVDGNSFVIDKKQSVKFDAQPDYSTLSDYQKGDAANQPVKARAETDIKSGRGMASAAAYFGLNAGQELSVEVEIPLSKKQSGKNRAFATWPGLMRDKCELNVPDGKMNRLYEIALCSILLHSPKEVWAGPYTYKRFWFRDAVLILNAMICAGFIEQAETVIDGFLSRQWATGYFHSQYGEWDSNGQVLWIMNRFCRFTNRSPKEQWFKPIIKAANWLIRKRITDVTSIVDGLLPPGFSAEHLGPNDYYYWDNFWAAAGLQAAAEMLKNTEHKKDAEKFTEQANSMLGSISVSLVKRESQIGSAAMPASAYRRLDSASVGSLAAGYPLQLFEPNDRRVIATAGYLLNNCMVRNAFFHQISHSGINPYLSLHLAQVLMMAGDRRFEGIVKSIAELASPTGQWPEAINPRTGGGCMGDGQHIWAAAEWVMMMRNCIVYEEAEHLVIGGGILDEWMRPGSKILIGPVLTSFGKLNVDIEVKPESVEVSWQGEWYKKPEQIIIRLPGYQPFAARADKGKAALKPGGNI